MIFQELYVPGILYYVCGCYAAICIVSCYFLPETKDLDLNDNIESTPKKIKEAESSNHIWKVVLWCIPPLYKSVI